MRCTAGDCANGEPLPSFKPGENRMRSGQRSGARESDNDGEGRAKNSAGARLNFESTRALKVGPYWGNSPSAQVLTLLHELGHVIDRLPADGGDQEGRSAQNTSEVLRYCRAEVESSVRWGTLAARR